MTPRPRVTLLYHFFHPDDVVSARQFSDLGASLAARGWEVIARPSNRTWNAHGPRLARREHWQGVDIRRVWRPPFRQSSHLGRLVNAVWMLAAWTLAAAFSSRRRREAVIIGTDPVFAVLAAAPWRLFHPRAQVIHWCFDVYPDAIVAEGAASPDSLLVRMLQRLVAAAYRRCDAIAGLGPCMARRLAASAPEVPSLTITPWALIEPDVPPSPDVETRKALFGDAALGLLYSGSFGRAHSHPEFMDLARRLRQDDIAFCFAGRGHRMDELRAAVEPADTNILFAGFAPEEELERRLAACDLHLVSLRQEWTGTVVPSKFFGALAAGRGVIFAGSAESSIAHWIREFQVGWVLLPETGEEVASELRELVRRPERIRALRAHCHAVYQERFSRERMLEKWEVLLRPLGGRGPRVTETHELSEVGGGHSRAN